MTGAGADHAPGVIVLTRRLGRPVGSWIGARQLRSPAQLNHLRSPSVAPRRYATAGPRRATRSDQRDPLPSTPRFGAIQPTRLGQAPQAAGAALARSEGALPNPLFDGCWTRSRHASGKFLLQRMRTTLGGRSLHEHLHDPPRRRTVPGSIPSPLNHLRGPVPVDRSRLDETHEATPTDPLAWPDLSGQIVAGT